MAAKPSAKPAAAPAAAAEAPKKGFPVMLVLIVLLGGLGVGGGAAWFLLPKPEAEAAEAEAPARKEVPRGAPAQYVPLQPAFVVNLADEGSTRYLQAEVQLSSRDPQV
ncbi:MAG: flagellar basal body-associated FliL family protein, partial [Aquimonas sp.]